MGPHQIFNRQSAAINPAYSGMANEKKRKQSCSPFADIIGPIFDPPARKSDDPKVKLQKTYLGLQCALGFTHFIGFETN